MKNLEEKSQHRLAMIQDDLNALREFINSDNDLQAKFKQPTAYAESAMHHLNNIEIACDINDEASLSWKLFTKPE